MSYNLQAQSSHLVRVIFGLFTSTVRCILDLLGTDLLSSHSFVLHFMQLEIKSSRNHVLGDPCMYIDRALLL